MRALFALLCVAALLTLTSCRSPGEEKYGMTDAQLNLAPQQSEGRRIFNGHCLRCHEAYINKGRNGPTMKGLYRKSVMPSGTPVNDERVAEVIVRGKRMMPPSTLTDEQVTALLDYLRTL